MLTTAGHDFFNLVKEAEAERTVNGAATNRCKIIGNLSTNELTQADANKIASVIGKGKDDKYSFTVKVAGGASGSVQTPIEFTVTGKNEAESERLASWILAGQAKVDILAGSNRYATAVTIAKEYAKLTGSTVSNGGNAKIVLVNGDSLVDGLAASPLASALTGNDADNKAPILLTESDRLPSETKAYLKEVISNVAIGSLKNAELHIVGGESVVSKSLERELKSLGFNNTYTLAVKKETAEKYNLETISDLARVSNKLVISPTLTFDERKDCLVGLQETYTVNFKDIVPIDGTPRYTALMSGECDVIDAYSTDGLLKKFDLKVLKDDKQFFLPYNAIPVTNDRVKEDFPVIEKLLNELGQYLKEETMVVLYYRVDELKQKPSDVAKDFLQEKGLIE